MTRLTIQGPWTGSRLATGDQNSKFPEIFVVSLYLRDLLVFNVISLVNIYNSEKRNFEKKGKISVDFSSVWWMKKFFFESDTTTSRDPTRWAGDAEMRV